MFILQPYHLYLTSLNLPSAGWDAGDLAQFFAYVKWFIGEHQMWIMLVIAFLIAVFASDMILSLFTRRNDDDEYDIM